MSKELQHTPGPWVALNPHSGLWQIFAEKRESHTVAIAVLNHSNDQSNETRDVITPADAHLMAASPQLLHALETILAAYDKQTAHIQKVKGYADPENFALARAAIAKAKPNQQ